MKSSNPIPRRAAKRQRREAATTALKLLPPEPKGTVDPALQCKVDAALAKRDQGIRFNDALQNMKSFKNPYILDRIAARFSIDQTGTNFPSDVFSTTDIEEEDYFEALREERARVEAERLQNRSEIEFKPPKEQEKQ